jgi:putative membrane protein
MLDILKNGFYGLIIGAAMLIPGVSGGTTAIILGIYDRLVASVSSFFKDIKHNFIFLAAVAVGGILGVLLFAKPLQSLVNLWEAPMLCLFMGATCGSLPMLIRKSKGGFRFYSVVAALAGFALVLSISLLPEGLFSFDTHSVSGFLILLVSGIPLAVALVLPGISVSYMMLVIGIWEPMLNAVSSLDIFFLAPLAIGLGLGVILTTKVLEYAMNRHPGQTYFAIIGFVLGSVLEIVREIPKPEHLYIYPVCVLMFAAGTAAIWFYASKIE